jgi:hypothetical protein
MRTLAWRNLVHDKVRLAVTLTGIVFAVVLIVVELGLFLGFTTATSSLIDDEPTERVDTKVLEALIELEDGRELPLGLRVQAFITR